MKRFFTGNTKSRLSRLIVFVLGGLLLWPAMVLAQALTSVNMTANPSSVLAEAGQPFTSTITVTNPSTGSPVTGEIWISKVVKTSDSSVAYTAGSNPSTTNLSASGQGSLSYALGVGGSYTVDVCYRQTPTSSCLSTPRAFVVSVSNNPVGTTTPTTTTTPAATPSSSTVQLPNPIACNDATCLIGQVVRYILGSIAVVATLMFVWGGVMMLTSGGNADQVKRAKETLVWATIGVVVILLSWVIIKAVLQALTKTSS